METQEESLEVLLPPELADRIAKSSTILAGISLVCSLVFLLVALLVWLVRPARPKLDRLSFRLLLWSILFSAGYDLCYILLEPSLGLPISGAPCTATMYFQVVTMHAVNYFLTCIALNLALTICLSMNPLRLGLEKWYVGGSLVLAFVQPIVPAALGHFGEDPVYESCYFTASEQQPRLVNMMVDLYLWQLAATLIATGCILATIITLFRGGRATARALVRQAQDRNTAAGDTPEGAIVSEDKSLPYDGDRSWPTQTQTSSASDTFCPMKQWVIKQRTSRLSRGSSKARGEGTGTYTLQDKLFKIALKISLYPVFMIVMNTVLVACDVYLSFANEAVDTKADLGLYIVYYTLYGSRNLFLIAGVQAAWAVIRNRARRNSKPLMPGTANDMLDLSAALASTSEGESNRIPRAKERQRLQRDRNSSRPRALDVAFTQSFIGVEKGCLPAELSDEVDVALNGISTPNVQAPKAVMVTQARIAPTLSTGIDSSAKLDEGPILSRLSNDTSICPLDNPAALGTLPVLHMADHSPLSVGTIERGGLDTARPEVEFDSQRQSTIPRPAAGRRLHMARQANGQGRIPDDIFGML